MGKVPAGEFESYIDSCLLDAKEASIWKQLQFQFSFWTRLILCIFIVNLTQALELDNCDATLYSNRSLCYVQIGNAQKGLLDADVCIARRPNWVKGYYRKGAAHMSLKVGNITILLVICCVVYISLLWIICPYFVPQEHKKAVNAFLDGLKLDPANAQIEKVFW
jgi:tetratricopeptide (TPR) repeat protein